MAFWKVPLDNPAHARQACKAALSMRGGCADSMRNCSPKRRTERHPLVRLRWAWALIPVSAVSVIWARNNGSTTRCWATTPISPPVLTKILNHSASICSLARIPVDRSRTWRPTYLATSRWAVATSRCVYSPCRRTAHVIMGRQSSVCRYRRHIYLRPLPIPTIPPFLVLTI